MIHDLLQPENIRRQDEVTDWKDAIHTALLPLQEGGWCTLEYEDSVLENTAKYGPYYVLCPELALIHAGFEKGVKGTQMAVTVLKKPVRFLEEGPDVRVLVALAAADRTAHMEGIRATANIFSDPEKINNVLHASTTNEIYQLFIENSAEI